MGWIEDRLKAKKTQAQSEQKPTAESKEATTSQVKKERDIANKLSEDARVKVSQDIEYENLTNRQPKQSDKLSVQDFLQGATLPKREQRPNRDTIDYNPIKRIGKEQTIPSERIEEFKRVQDKMKAPRQRSRLMAEGGDDDFYKTEYGLTKSEYDIAKQVVATENEMRQLQYEIAKTSGEVEALPTRKAEIEQEAQQNIERKQALIPLIDEYRAELKDVLKITNGYGYEGLDWTGSDIDNKILEKMSTMDDETLNNTLNLAAFRKSILPRIKELIEKAEEFKERDQKAFDERTPIEFIPPQGRIGIDAMRAEEGLKWTVPIENLQDLYESVQNNDFSSGYKEAFSWADVVTFGLQGIVDSANILTAIHKQERGQTLTDEDKFFLEVAELESALEEWRKSKGGASWTNNVGSGLAHTTQFMAETAMTGGMGGGMKLATSGVKGAFRLGVKQGMKRLMLRNIPQAVGYGAARSAIMPSTYSNILDRRIDQYSIVNGEVELTNPESLLKSIGVAWTDQTFEISSELWGGFLAMGFGKVGKMLGVNKLSNTLRKSKVGDVLSIKTTPAWRRALRDGVGWTGDMPSEITSEFLGDVATNLAYEAFNENETYWEQLGTLNYWSQLVATVAGLKAGFTVASLPNSIASNRELKKLEARSAAAFNAIGNEELKNKVLNLGGRTDIEDVAEYMHSIDWSQYKPMQVAHAIDYMMSEVERQVVAGSETEQERAERYTPRLERIQELAYRNAEGVAMPTMVTAEAKLGADNTQNVTILEGDYTNPDAMVSVLLNDGTTQPIIASKLSNVKETDMASLVAEDYAKTFAGEDAMETLGEVEQTLADMQRAGASNTQQIRAVEKAGLTVFNADEQVTLLNGEEATVVEGFRHGLYTVMHADGSLSMVGLGGILQPDVAIAQAQRSVAMPQEQTPLSQSAPLPEGIDTTTDYATPDGFVGKAVDYNAESDQVTLQSADGGLTNVPRASLTTANAEQIAPQEDITENLATETISEMEQGEAEAEAEATPMPTAPKADAIPQNADGSVDYESITDATMYANAIESDMGNVADAQEAVVDVRQSKEAELAKLQEQKKQTANMNEKVALKQQEQKLVQQIAMLNEVESILGSRATAVEAETAQVNEAVETAPIAEATEQTAPTTEQKKPTEPTRAEVEGVKDNYLATQLRNENPAEYNTFNALAKLLGLEIEFVESAGEGNALIVGNKMQVAYNPANREEALRFLIGHESLHRLKQVAPEAYAELMEDVKAHLGEELFGRRKERLQQRYKQRGIAITEESLEEEVVADFIGEMEEDYNVVSDLVTNNPNKSWWQKLIEGLRNLFAFLEAASADTTKVASILNKIETAYKTAAEKVQTLEVEKPVTTTTEAAEVRGAKLSIKTEDHLESNLRKFATSKDGKRAGWTPQKVDSIIEETKALINAIDAALRGNSFYDAFADREPTIRTDWRDGVMKPTVTWTRANIEYKYDMSADLLCINNDGIENVLASAEMVGLMKLLPTKATKEGGKVYDLAITADDYLTLYDIMDKMGYVVPCKGCFDAAGRFKMLPSVAQKFVADVNATIDERNANPEKFDEGVRKMVGKKGAKTIEGLPAKAETKKDAIRIGVAGDKATQHLDWTDFMSAEGQAKMLETYGGIFRAWQRTGAGRPKDKLPAEPYYGDIMSNTTTIIGKFGEKTPSFREVEVNQGTGLRRNSHSEFRPILAVDEIQFMRDAFIRGLFVFKYMKELDDVRLFGNMGVKFNISFFPAFVEGGKAAGLDANGNYIASEESAGAREFAYEGEDGNIHYDGMKGWEEAKKYTNEDVSLSSVVFSIPHLIKALTDVPTPTNKEGEWGSLIPFHASGATEKQLTAQGLGKPRAMGTSFDEAMSDYDKGVTNFEHVQNDRFGEGWVVVAGKKAGTKVKAGHKIEFANGNHYFNAERGLHLFSSGYIVDSELTDEQRDTLINGEEKARSAVKKEMVHPFVVDYNDKVREIGTPHAYKEAADYYIKALRDLGLIPRFEFEVKEDVFLKMCADANVDPRHPKLGWKGEGHSWSPTDAESYYSLFCDYGMTNPETGEWSPHRAVGYINENGEREFRLPDNAVEIVKEGLDTYTARRNKETAMDREAIRAFADKMVEQGRLTENQVNEVLGEKKLSLREGKTFYSNAEFAVRNIKQEKATPEQWLKMIEKNGGLKAGEDKWLGLSDWLKASDKKTLTKDEVLDYIHQNQIQIEEVNYAEVGSPFIDRATRKLEAEMKEIGIEAMREKYPDFDDFFEVFQGELVWSEQKASEGEYEDYIIENNILDVDTEAEAINETRLRYTTNGLDNNREIALTVPTIEPWNTPDAVHFGDAGGGRAVAWIRFGETTDAEGKRVLVIDEIQSKRHQEGREKGYRDDAELTRLKDRENTLLDESVSIVKDILHKQGYIHHSEAEAGVDGRFDVDVQIKAEEGKLGSKEQMDRIKAIVQEINDIIVAKRNIYTNSVPEAPFEKNWAELAMKRMLRYAAENGYDKVAWTTGDQQADRYNLSEKVDSIIYKANDNGTYQVSAMVAGRGHKLGDEIPQQELSNYVGKELADRIINSEGYKTSVSVPWPDSPYEFEKTKVEEWNALSGGDLKIGGEGMKAFYDQMLPSFMRKYGKKWGATVGAVTMPNLEENNTMHSVDVTPAMRESVMQGQPMFSLRNPEWQSQFGVPLADGKELSLEDVRTIFGNTNSDTLLGEIFDRVYAVMEKLPRKVIKVVEELPDGRDVLGTASVKGDVTYRLKLFKGYREQAIAEVLLHELIHSVTTYATHAYAKQAKGDNYAKAYDVLPTEIKKACRELQSVYNRLSKKNNLKGEYGVKNISEMLAELSNPEFRALVEESGFWQTLLNAIKRMLGFEGTYNAELKELDNILSSFLENYNEEAYMDAVESIYQREIFPTTIEEVDAKEADNQGEDVKFSLKSLDAPYLDAVARGDMATAERMVREAAAIAMPNTKVVDKDGLPKVVYHGGTFGQESYDEYNPYIWDGDGGAWFSTNEEYSNNYLKEDNTSPIKVFLDLRNIADLGDSNRFIIDDGKMTSAIEEIANKLGVGVEDIYNIIDWDYANKGAEFVNLQGKRIKLEESAEQYAINRTRGLVEMLEKAGYDGATNIEVNDVVTYMATSPNQIKSADVVTYDDAGNIIPLSERFNPEKEDIRYSLREATGEEVKEYLADALQAAKANRLEQIDKRYDYIADTAKKGRRPFIIGDMDAALALAAPDGKEGLSLELQITYDIANGLKFRWADSEGGIYKGLQQAIGDRKSVAGILDVQEGAYLNEYATRLAEQVGMSAEDVQKVVVNVVRNNPSRKAAIKALGKDIPFEYNERVEQAIEDSRARAKDKEKAKFEASLNSPDGNTPYARLMQDEAVEIARASDVLRDMRAEIRGLRKKHAESKYEQAVRIEKVRKRITDMVGTYFGRNMNAAEIKTLVNLISKAHTPEALERALDMIQRQEFNVQYRMQRQRKGRLLQNRISFAFTGNEMSVEQYLRQEGVDDATIKRLLSNRFKGVDAKGISVAKFVSAEVAKLMELVNEHIALATPQSQTESDTTDRDIEKQYTAFVDALNEAAKDFPADLLNNTTLGAIIEDLPAIMRMYWEADAMIRSAKSYESDLQKVNKEIAEAEEYITFRPQDMSDEAYYERVQQGTEFLRDRIGLRDALMRQHLADTSSIVQLMTEANNAIEQMLLGGKQLLSEERKALEQHKRDVVQDALDDITNFGEETGRIEDKRAKNEHKVKWVQKLRDNLKKHTWNNWIWSLDYMLNKLAPYSRVGEGMTHQRIVGEWMDATNMERANMQDVAQTIDDKINSLWGKQYRTLNDLMSASQGIKVATVFYVETDKGIRHLIDRGKRGTEWVESERTIEKPLTMGEALYLLASWEQAGGRMKLEAHGIIADEIADIIRAIGEIDSRWLEMKDWVVQELLPSRREYYDAQHRRLNGAYMARVDNYFPIKIKKSEIHKEADVDAPAIVESSISPSAIINRTHNTKMIDLDVDFFKVMSENIATMEHWAAMEGVRRDINAILSNQKLRNLMDSEFGEDFHPAFLEAARTALGTLVSEAPKGFEKVLYYLTRKWAGSRISGRVITAFKQIAGLPAIALYWRDAGFETNLLKNLGTFGVRSWNKAREVLPMLDNRLKQAIGGAVELADFYKRLDVHTESGVKRGWTIFDDVTEWLVRQGMKPNVWVDFWASSMIGLTVYETRKESYLKKGYTEAMAERKARMEAEAAYNKTQQSAELLYLAPAQVYKTILTRAAATFMNNSIANERLGAEGLRDAAHAIGRWEKLKHNIYTQESIRIYNECIENGMDEADAKNVAVSEAREIANKASRAGTIGRGVLQAAWGLFLSQYVFQLTGVAAAIWLGVGALDDDDEEKLLDQAWDNSKLAALTNVPVLNLGASVLAGKKHDILPAYTTMQKDIETLQKAIEDDDDLRSLLTVADMAVSMGVGIDLNTAIDIADGIADMENGDWREGWMDVVSLPKSQVKLIVGKRGENETAEKYMTRILRTTAIIDKKKIDEAELGKYNYQTGKWEEEPNITAGQKRYVTELYNQYQEEYKKDMLDKCLRTEGYQEVGAGYTMMERRHAAILAELGVGEGKKSFFSYAKDEQKIAYMSELAQNNPEAYNAYNEMGNLQYQIRDAENNMESLVTQDGQEYIKALANRYDLMKEFAAKYEEYKNLIK